MVTYTGVSVASFGLWIGLCHYTGIDARWLSTTTTSTLSTASKELEAALVEVQDDVAKSVQAGSDALVEGFKRFNANLHRLEGTLDSVAQQVKEQLDSGEQAAAVVGADLSRHGVVLATAWLAHNITFPVRLGVTAALTPYVAARIRGGYVDVLLKRMMTRLTPKATAAAASDSNSKLKSTLLEIRK
ncbi:hypothetical protein HDU99_000245 [Rhizoclosmatium hyalinum]|nr:hypothetical protein HDU99_000245 [Rhizoclosmatium hyalinum]